MKYTNFDEFTFRQSVDKAVEKVRAVLGTTKNPHLAEDDPDHTYDDKFALAEFVSNTSLASQVAILEHLGLTPNHLKTVLKWIHEEKETATLHFQAEDACSYLTEKEVELTSTNAEDEHPSSSGDAAQSSSFFGTSSSWSSETNKPHRVVQKVKEHHWKVNMTYKLKIYKGNDPSIAIELQSRSSSTVLITPGGQATTGTPSSSSGSQPVPPIPEKTVHPATEVQLTWLLQQTVHSMSSEDASAPTSQFKIDRAAESCKTPRRNEQIQASYDFHQSLVSWMLAVQNFFLNRLENEILSKHTPAEILSSTNRLEAGTKCQMVGLDRDPHFNSKHVVVREYLLPAGRYRVEPLYDNEELPPSITIKRHNLKVVDLALSGHPQLGQVSTAGLFIPVLPLLEKGSVLAMPDANALLKAQSQSIDTVIAQHITSVFPPRGEAKLASQAEAQMLLLCTHWLDLIEQYQSGINYIEFLLRKQVIQAIGKEVNADDFDAFMRFHYRKLLGPKFAPKPFVHAVRRDQRHFPDGLVTIEASTTAGVSSKSRAVGRKNVQSIETMVRYVSGADSPSIFIPINAATSVEMTGDRYLHGWMQHRFESSAPGAQKTPASMLPPTSDFRLVARARQLSSFILMVGTMGGSESFEPRAAIIVRNKDEVIIPILTNALPTTKEFTDAIASLSPEQQAFCRAFRGMQLESSVFGVCIIQLKPQLEKLLELPDDSLTKEIHLTHDITSLFVDYQMPSDLLSFVGEDDASGAAKVESVKSHVKAVMDVIAAEKAEQQQEEERKAEAKRAMLRKQQEEEEAEEEKKEEEQDHESEKEGDDDQKEDEEKEKEKSQKPQQLEDGDASLDQMSDVDHLIDVDAVSSSGSSPPPTPKNKAKQLQAIMAAPQTVDSDVELKQAIAPNTAAAALMEQPTQTAPSSVAEEFFSSLAAAEDFTLVPKTLDSKFAQFDTDNSLRSTILAAGPTWTRLRKDKLLTPAQTTTLDQDAVIAETNKAFDLLDAISRSGTLPIDCAELHVLVAVSHCFENDVMGTVVQDNLNPIEKVEKSALMVGSTIYGESCTSLLADSAHAERLTETFPALFIDEE